MGDLTVTVAITITETNSGKTYNKEVYEHSTIPAFVPCHNPRCKTGRAFDIRPVIDTMQTDGVTHHSGTAACESPKNGRGDCVNFFEYTITLADSDGNRS